MRFYREAKRLKDTIATLKGVPLRLGPNRQQELVRLIYEVSKRDNIKPRVLLKEAFRNHDSLSAKQGFIYLKDFFLRKRFPSTYANGNNGRYYLPKISFDDNYVVSKRSAPRFYPEIIFIERGVEDYSLTKSILKKFPRAKRLKINSLKDHIKLRRIKSGQDATLFAKDKIGDYNFRTKKLFLIKEKHDFLKCCPCTNGALRCGYHILNLGFGCMYDCSYCFLQSYTNVDGIILPVNVEDFLKRLDTFLGRNTAMLRFGTGEFSDSLALDDLTGYSRILVDFFSRVKNATVELKTKSSKVKNLLTLKHNKKTIVSWSLNPQPIIDSDEWQTSSLKGRLEAARQCVDAGYLVGFHFDPIIYSHKWQSLYRELVADLFRKINHKDIAWISLGTLRFNPKSKMVIEQRFIHNRILNEELTLEFDGKLRYSNQVRLEIYKKMFAWIRQYSSLVPAYLCMEPKEIAKEVLG